MSRYVLKRILIMIPTLLAVILIVFAIVELTPGSAARNIIGQDATPEAIEQLEEEMGLNRPFLMRYGEYVVNLCKGDMGDSYTSGLPVFEEIKARFGTTVKLALGGIFIAVIIGIPVGILSAVKQYSILDFINTAAAMLMASVPHFWLGLMLMLLFALKLGLLPPMGNETWAHFILPSITVSITTMASILRLTRTTMLETIRQDYVRTARSKGQTEMKVIVRHALKNAMLPVVTVIGAEFGYLLGGSIIVESVFSLNGVGALLLSAISFKNTPVVVGCTLTMAFFFMFIILLVDILYAYIDPRIKARYQKGGR